MKIPLPISLLALLMIGLAGCASDTPSPDADASAVLPATPPVTALPEATPAGKEMAPDFSLPTLSGELLNMADLHGKVLLINFWATWCGPCRHEIPDLIALQNELGPEQFSVVGISLDEEGPDIVRAFSEALGVNYPIALDDGAVAQAFGGVYALPTTFIVDQAGRISHRTIGLFPVEPFKEDLRTMLSSD